jgi:hypothetical protein
MNSPGPNPAQAAQFQGKPVRPRPRWQTCTEALYFWISVKNPYLLFNVSLTNASRSLNLCFFSKQVPDHDALAVHHRRGPYRPWPAADAQSSDRGSITDPRRPRNELYCGLNTLRTVCPRARRKPWCWSRVPNHLCPNWSNGCYGELYVPTELLEQHSRGAEPYQSDPATERGVLGSPVTEKREKWCRGGSGWNWGGGWDWGYTAVRNCSFTVHNQFGRRWRRQCESWVLLKLAVEAVSASPWFMPLFKATTDRLEISGRG